MSLRRAFFAGLVAPAFQLPDHSQYLTFDGGFAVMPPVAGIRTVRVLFRVNYIYGVRADHLFDLDAVDNSYAVAVEANYGEFGGVDHNIPVVYANGVPYTTPGIPDSQGRPRLGTNALFDGTWRQVTFQLDAATGTVQPWLFCRNSNSSAVYYLHCQVAHLEFFNRVLTAGEKASGSPITTGLLAHYATQTGNGQWLDLSGNNRHATLYGTYS